MSSGKQAFYLVRLDDASPWMDRNKWGRVEETLDRYGVTPLVAVIPDNHDSREKVSPADPGFWEKVRGWAEKGWLICQHGYRHVYDTDDPGLIPINRRSEFAGHSFEEQCRRIRRGWEILQEKGLQTRIWVAPAHTFDNNTLKALKEVTGIDIISDGLALYPYEEDGFLWVPQQLWRGRPRLWGTWTICLHPNTMTEKDFSRLESFLARNHSRFRGSVLEHVERFRGRRRSLLDKIYFHWFFFTRGIIKLLLRFRK